MDCWHATVTWDRYDMGPTSGTYQRKSMEVYVLVPRASGIDQVVMAAKTALRHVIGGTEQDWDAKNAIVESLRYLGSGRAWKEEDDA